jgi:hypothetical protein
MTDRDPTMLDYRGGDPAPKWVTLRKFYSDFEANLAANELAANDIRWQLFNDDSKSVLSAYGAFIQIRLCVLSDDEARAKQILARHVATETGDLEPAEQENPDQPLEIADEDGDRATWSTAAVFESARALHEAAMVLESAHLSVLLPRLVPRGEAPAGEGPRFVLRVQADDVGRAKSLLQHAAEETAEEEFRCPQCGAYSIHEASHGVANLFLSLVGKAKPDECECMKCHYKGDPSEFGKRE